MTLRTTTLTLLLGGLLLLAVAAAGQEISAAQTGEQLITKMGCAGCHTIADPTFQGLRRRGPDLRKVASKTDPGWAVMWINGPRDFRPTTWMPHFFDGQADPRDIHAIVSYLWDRSERVDFPEPPAGNAENGETLFNSRGCTGCHLRDGAAKRADHQDDPFRLQGPNLVNLGSKVDAGWLFAWLKDPKAYAPQTLMPNLRLSDEEAADLVAFLLASRNESYEDMAFSKPTGNDVAVGLAAIARYGCHGCHLIPGFEDALPPYGELTAVETYDEHPLGKGLPNYGLTDAEAEAVQARLASLGAPSDASPALSEGRRLVRMYNCQGCHLVEERGHAIRATVDDVGMLPPNLKSQGSRVQDDWLKGFLRDPSTVRLRPWLTAEMPTFGFREGETSSLVEYFKALEEEELTALPEGEIADGSKALGEEIFAMLQCARCHPAGADAAAALGLTASNLAPSLEIASERLRYEWITQWILDPPRWQPGTKMPTFFYQAEPGEFQSPFAGVLETDMFVEPKKKVMPHFASEEELAAFLEDAPALAGTISDYIWSLNATK